MASKPRRAPSSTVDGALARSTALAKPYEPGPILRWVYRRFFAHISVDERWSGAVRESARQGVVVYVMRSISFLDFLCLHSLLRRLGLPMVRFVNDLGLGLLEPFGKGLRRLRMKKQRPEDEALAEVVQAKASALLFLRRPPRLGSTARKGEELDGDLIRTLVETQRKIDEPILILPQTFVWNMRPPARRRGLVDFFFGPVQWPGRIRVFVQFLFNYRNAKLRSGEAFNLQRFMDTHQDLTDAEVADKVRYLLLRRMERERTLVLGPTQKTPGRIMEELLRSPRVRRHIEKQARSSKRSIARVEREARKDLKRLAANQQPSMISFLDRVLAWVFRRIYDGLVLDDVGLERVRDAARESTLIYLPSHKSHVDYLVLSYVLYQNALSTPLIAAGENLSFFPLGPLLRRGGAFFIKRSFHGKKLYSALVDAYMRKLIVGGFPIEFFIEGGRSRTGKLQPPKYGLLSMVVDAALKCRMQQVSFVPVSIGYERVVEERSYVHELSGGEKQEENVGGLLRTPKVLRSKYGRLYVQFGEILSLDRMLEQRDLDAATITPSARRGLVQGLARRVSFEIDQVTVVTPAALVATALLGHRRRGIVYEQLRARCAHLCRTLDAAGAPTANAILNADGSVREERIREAIALFEDAGLVKESEVDGDRVFRVPDPRRIALEYYKNNILHFFVPQALIASALRLGDATKEALLDRARRLSEVFEYEFAFRSDSGFDHVIDAAIERMLEAEELLSDTQGVIRRGSGASGDAIPVYEAMLRTYFESYTLAARAADRFLQSDAMSRKEWLKKSLELGQRMYLAGEFELRESISKHKLENALKAFKKLKLVSFGAMSTLQADNSGEGLTRMRAELERQLER